MTGSTGLLRVGNTSTSEKLCLGVSHGEALFFIFINPPHGKKPAIYNNFAQYHLKEPVTLQEKSMTLEKK